MKIFYLTLIVTFSVFSTSSLNGHCQVPCGIFDDEVKFSELKQNVETIAKAGKLIREISAQKSLSAKDKQQLIRWTIQKESHAQKIVDTAADYFLAQRIKTDAEHYDDKMKLLHHIIIYSMKSKQSVEYETYEALDKKIAAFEELYLHHNQAH